MPFILRGGLLAPRDRLLGHAAGRAPADLDHAGGDDRPADIEQLVHSEIGLDAVMPDLRTILAGGMQGRVLVEPVR